MLDYLQQYSGALTFLATLLLVALTAFYAYWTKGILAATANQSRLTLCPVIGIEISEIGITGVFGPDRRNMTVALTLSNVGNAPAIEVLVDAEIELRHSNINGETTIPARFSPHMVPFIQPGQSISGPSVYPGFGNAAIAHIFDDVRESRVLNRRRIETKSRQESFLGSRLRIIAYYRNSLGQHFKSYYETEMTLWSETGAADIPADDESAELKQIYIPRPVFHAGVFDKPVAEREIEQRNAKRKLSGW